jgi:Flp pilus assembly protein TadD
VISAFQEPKTPASLGVRHFAGRTKLPRTAAAQTPSADSLCNDAGQAYDRGDFEKAISLYEALIQLQPQSMEARTNLGVALAHVGRYDEAIAQYREALKYARQNPKVRLNLALAQYKEGDFAKAADALIRLRADHPQDTSLCTCLPIASCIWGKTTRPWPAASRLRHQS